MKFTQIDVSELLPPEPMTYILSALAQLTQETPTTARGLRVKHRRQPFPLYEKLTAAGWAYHCQVRADDDIYLYIYQQTEHQAFEQFYCTELKQCKVNLNE